MKQFKTIFFTALVTALITLTAIAAYNLYVQPADSGKTASENSGLNVQPAKYQSNDERNEQIQNSRHNIITETVKAVSPAVVGINVTQIKTYQDPWAGVFGNDPFFRRFFGDRSYKQKIKSLGSGAIISPDGYIITNDHVAGNAVEIIVTMTDGTQHSAKVIGSDKISDICLLKIETDKELPFINLGNSSDIMIGEWVIALGNPFGLFQINDKPTVTVGVISALNMSLGEVGGRYYIDMIQTDASINGGNSGGPLVNSVGELIGMNTLIYSPNGNSGSVGVGFAIPVNKIKKIISQIKENGKVDRNFWTGLRIQTIDEGIAKYYNLPSERGVIVTYVEKYSPAYKAGIKVGDIVIQVDKYRINDDNTLIGVLQDFGPGDKILFTVIRDNNERKLEMVLEERND